MPFHVLLHVLLANYVALLHRCSRVIRLKYTDMEETVTTRKDGKNKGEMTLESFPLGFDTGGRWCYSVH